MSSSSVENVCYNNPFFESGKNENGEATVTIDNKPAENESTENDGNERSQTPNKSEPQNRLLAGIRTNIFGNIPEKYEPVVGVLYLVTCFVMIILMSNIIQSLKSGGSKKPKCNVCGNGTEVYYLHNMFGNIWGERCDAVNAIESSYTCENEDSVCIKVETELGSGAMARLEDNKKWYLQHNNETWEEMLKKEKYWLYPWYPGTIKGCLHGSGHSWVRNEYHTFNSSEWDFERFDNRYNSTWTFMKTSVCNKDHCN